MTTPDKPEEEVQPEVECNTCGWNGNTSDLDTDDEGEICPDCGSDNLYFFPNKEAK